MYIYSKKQEKVVNPELEIVHRIKSKQYNTFIYIVPTRRKVRHLNRELLELSPDKAIPQLNIFTIGDLATKLFQEKFEGWSSISQSLQYFFIKKIISESSLSFFHTKTKYIHNGVIELLISVISRLKELGVSDRVFATQLERFDAKNKNKAKDISYIYTKYQELLSKLCLYDLGEIYLSINNFSQSDFNRIFRKIFPDVNFLLISGFNEFTQPELDLIEKLSNINDLEVIITLDFNAENLEIFMNLQNTHERLIKLNFDFVDDHPQTLNNEFISTVKKYLFQNNRNLKFNSQNVFYLSAVDRRDEIETIARIIKHKLMNDPEIDLSNICIAINNISEYSNLIREIFYKYGIPVNVTDRFYLKNSPPIISIISLIKLISSDYFYKDLFKVLSSSYFDFKSINVYNLRKTLEELKITRGYDKIIKAIELRIEYLEKLNSEENDIERKQLKIDLLKKSKEDLESINNLLKPLKKEQTPKDFVKTLQNIIHRLNVSEKVFEVKLSLSEQTSIESYEKDIKALSLFNKILEELIFTFEKLSDERKFDLASYYEFITSAISGSRFNIKERWGYGVLVTSPNEIRGLKFDTLFICGLNNGSFPTQYIPLIFLQENYIRNEKQHLLEERYLFYQSLCAFNKELYLTHPRQDEKRELLVSDFLVELKNLFEIKEFDDKALNEYLFSITDIPQQLLQFDFQQIEIKNTLLRDKLLLSKEIQNRMLKRLANEIELSGEFCGIITDKDLIANLESIILNKAFSATEIEDYARCPFQYLMKDFYKIEIEKEIKEDVDKREMGILIHNILHRFHKKLVDEKRKFYDELTSNYDKILEEIKSIAKEELESIQNFNPYFFLVRSEIFGSEGKKSLLESYLEYEQTVKNKNFQPYLFEISLNTELQINNQKVRVKGKLDRIDFDETSNSMRIIDYKTGKTIPSKYDYENKITFQLPLYFKLLEKSNLDLPSHFKIEDAHFYHLHKDRQNQFRSFALSEELTKYYSNDFHKTMESILEELFTLINQMKKGVFYLTKKNKAEEQICKYCNYKSICRIEWIEKTKDNPEEVISLQ